MPCYAMLCQQATIKGCQMHDCYANIAMIYREIRLFNKFRHGQSEEVFV